MMMYTAQLRGVGATLLTPSEAIASLLENGRRESRIRVRSALKETGIEPRANIGEVYADLAKMPDVQPSKMGGAAYDLPIAMHFAKVHFDGLVVGSLGLDGEVRPVRGIIPMLLEAKKWGGTKRALIPASQFHEAQLVEGIDLVPCGSLADAVSGSESTIPNVPITQSSWARPCPTDLTPGLREPFTLAAEAILRGEHVLLTGGPGSGKTMIARRLPAMLPKMTAEEELECAAIRSATGLQAYFGPIDRPFRAPHHTASRPALMGTGWRPGEMTLAHHGILFLDDFPEFRRADLEAVTQVALAGKVVHGVAPGWDGVRYPQIELPAKTIIVAAMNPCPCGHYGTGKCRCSKERIQRYDKRTESFIEHLNMTVVSLLPKSMQDLMKSRTTLH